MDDVLYGKRYRKPSKDELEEADKGYLEGSNNKHSFGFGTTATIHFDKHTQNILILYTN